MQVAPETADEWNRGGGSLLQLSLLSHVADVVQLPLQRHSIEHLQAEARENLEPGVQLS